MGAFKGDINVIFILYTKMRSEIGMWSGCESWPLRLCTITDKIGIAFVFRMKMLSILVGANSITLKSDCVAWILKQEKQLM